MKTFTFEVHDSWVCASCQQNDKVHYNIVAPHRGRAHLCPDTPVWCNRCECETNTQEPSKDFPYEEVRDASGDYFRQWGDVARAGFNDDQIWCVTYADEHNGTWICHDSAPHFVNVLGFVGTKERSAPGERYEAFCLNPSEDE